jgi:SsrA-binding protein
MEAIVNKKAKFNFILEDTYEAGIVLEGWEIKPILARKVNLDASYVIIKNGEIFLINAQVNPEKTTSTFDKAVSTRTRKLLLNKREIMQLIGKVEQKGYTMVATRIYNKGNKIKLQIALAKGKQDHDKRNTIKERDWEREQAQIMKKKAN